MKRSWITSGVPGPVIVPVNCINIPTWCRRFPGLSYHRAFVFPVVSPHFASRDLCEMCIFWTSNGLQLFVNCTRNVVPGACTMGLVLGLVLPLCSAHDLSRPLSQYHRSSSTMHSIKGLGDSQIIRFPPTGNLEPS